MNMSIEITNEEAASLLLLMDQMRLQVSTNFRKKYGMLKSRKMIITYKEIEKNVKKPLKEEEHQEYVVCDFEPDQFEMLSEFVKTMLDLLKKDARVNDSWCQTLKSINYEILQATIANVELECTNVNA